MSSKTAPKAKRRSPAEWQEARDWFVQGRVNDKGEREYPSLEEIADYLGVHHGSARRRSSQEGWSQQRRIFVTKVTEARDAKIREKTAGEGAEFDANNLKIARALQTHVAKNIAKVTQGDNVLDAKQIKELAGALSQVQKIGRLALGEETDRTGVNAHFDVSGLSDDQLEAYEGILAAIAGSVGDPEADPRGEGTPPPTG